MKEENRDKIIEELWQIKDEFSESSNHDLEKLVHEMNSIAEKLGFQKNVINLREQIKTP